MPLTRAIPERIRAGYVMRYANVHFTLLYFYTTNLSVIKYTIAKTNTLSAIWLYKLQSLHTELLFIVQWGTSSVTLLTQRNGTQ